MKNKKVLGAVLLVAVIAVGAFVALGNSNLQGTLTVQSSNQCPGGWELLGEFNDNKANLRQNKNMVNDIKKIYNSGCDLKLVSNTDPTYSKTFLCGTFGLTHFSTKPGMFPVMNLSCYSDNNHSVNIQMDLEINNGIIYGIGVNSSAPERTFQVFYK